MITVTKPFLPPIEAYQKLVNEIWDRQWLTNNGPLVNELELKLKHHLGVNHMLYLSNGTIALQIAIKALNLAEEIITTPFSYVATASSIVWEGCNPVFADIEADTLNIDPARIEEAITKKTTAILATHVYGNPCHVEAIESIAKKHGLKVIYDAAHGFGTAYKGESIFQYGDVSTTSFHATKIFHTIEGGAVFTQNPELLKKMAFMRNFGHDGPDHFAELGINGKNSEFHAAMGLLNLKYIEEIISRRKSLSEHYDSVLSNLNHYKPRIINSTEYNYSYYPIILPSENLLLKMVNLLNQNLIYPRRYFHPSLDSLPYVKVNKSNVPVSQDISRRVLSLPLYHTLSFSEIDMIARLMLRVQNN